MSLASLHFSRIAELVELELRLVEALLAGRLVLSRWHENLLRYALVLARVGRLRLRVGRELELAEELTPFRAWLRDELGPCIGVDGRVDAWRLQELVPLVAVRLHALREALLVRHANELSAEALDSEICQRKLALALGGGGGCGYAHLALFELLDEMGVCPDYIAGTSFGSLMGLFRALRRRYDPVTTVLNQLRKVELGEAIRPASGWSRFGFPGVFDLHIRPLAGRYCQAILGQPMPRLAELAIPLECVCSGLVTGFELDAQQLEQELRRRGLFRFGPWAARGLALSFAQVARKLLRDPRMLTEVVLGPSSGCGPLPVADGIAFSASVPGVLHGDLWGREPEAVSLLEGLFEERGLFRLADGGLVANVPTRAAWEAVNSGLIGSRNALVYGLDVFAPGAHRNALFFPLQQAARPNVLAGKRYATLLRSMQSPPSPLDIAPSHRDLQRAIRRAREEIAADVPLLRRLLAPLPRYESCLEALQHAGLI